MIAETKLALQGEYRIQRRNAETMEIIQDTGWFPNLILDNGLNQIASLDVGNTCVVGTGSTAPNVAQTTLTAQVASTTTKQSTSITTSGTVSSPYWLEQSRTFRFAVGAAAGNLSEVGMGNTASSLFSRALIVDGGGSPTTITVLSTEVLDVTYKLRVYCPLADVVQVIAVNSINYTMTVRARNAGTAWATDATGPMNGVNVSPTYFTPSLNNSGMTAITSSPPSGSQAGAESMPAYLNNSYYRDYGGTWDLNEGNVTGGANVFQFGTTLGLFQIGVSPNLPKTASNTLTFTLRISWARY